MTRKIDHNKSNLKNPFKAAMLFTLLSFLPSAINVFLLPVYLQYLDTTQYGLIAILSIFSGLFGMICNLQLNAAASVNFFDYLGSKQLKLRYMSSIYSTSLFISLIFFAIFMLAGPFIFDRLIVSNGIKFYPYGIIVICSSFFNQFYGLYFVFLKNEYNLKEFAIYSISLVVLNAGCQYYLIVIEDWGVIGFIVGTFISKLLIAGIVFISNRKLLTINLDKEMVFKSLKFAIYLIPAVLINWLITVSDKLFLNGLLSLSEVGRYSLLINLTYLSALVFGSMINAFRPAIFKLFSNLSPENIKQLRKLIIWYLNIGLIILSGVILVGSNLDLITTNEKYTSIMTLFPLAVFIMLPRLFNAIPNLQLMYLKKSGYISLVLFISYSLLIISLPILIPNFGLKGALYSLGLSNSVTFLLLFLKSRKVFNLKLIQFDDILKILTGVVIVIAIYLLIGQFEMSIRAFGIIQFSFIIFAILIRKESREVINYVHQLIRKDG